MAREKRSPSKWWFWSVPILANLYVVLVFAAFWALESGVFTGVFTGGLRIFLHRAARASFVPGILFANGAFAPLMELLNLDRLGDLAGLVLLVSVWELCAVAGGLLLYGGASLVSAILPGGADEKEGSSRG